MTNRSSRSSRSSRCSHFLLIASLAVLAVLAAACSDDSSSDDASSSSSTTADQPFISTGSAQCTVEDMTPAIPEGATLDFWECDAGWAAITYTTDGTQETAAYQAEGQFWIAMPCDAEGIPESISDLAC